MGSVVPDGYYQDKSGRWHRPNGLFASNEEVGLPAPKTTPSRSTHANSLDYQGPNYGYRLVDSDTGEVLKYGETTNPNGRYSEIELIAENADMDIMVVGSKREIHEWQHQKILEYTKANGVRPPLNFSDY